MKYSLSSGKIKSVCQKAIESGKVFYFLPAIYLGVLLISKGFVQPGGYYRLHYLFTYDHGFISRGLVGEVMSWFFDTITDDIIKYVVFGCCVVLIILSSLCFGRALNKVKSSPQQLTYALILTVIILLLPTSFRMQFGRITLDKFVWTLTVFAVFLSGNKVSVWAVPLVCVISTLINPVYVFSSMILIAMVLLQKFYSEGFSFRMGTICFISYAAIIIIALLSLRSTYFTGFTDTNEMLDFYYQRFVGESLTEAERQVFAEEWLFEYFLSFEEAIKRTFHYYFIEWGLSITVVVYTLTIVLPITTLLSAIWIKAIKRTEKKFQKFIYGLCLIAPVVILPEVVVGWEIPRYYSDCLIVQLALLLFFIVNRTEGISEAISDILDYFRRHQILSVIAVLHFSLLCIL